jgi:hypothetical protein
MWGIISLWHQRQSQIILPQSPRPQTPESFRAPKHRKSPSTARRDRQRSIQRDGKFFQRRQERLRLFGYVILRNGEVISPEEGLSRLRDGIRAKERDEKPKPNAILHDDILEWHEAEVYRDELVSKGEVDAISYFPALDIWPGVVLVDPKIRHRDPALNLV